MKKAKSLQEEELTPQEKKSAATRDRLIQATITCTSRYGLGQTSTMKISQKAGVSRGAIQHHFRNKDDLFLAALTSLSSAALECFSTPLPYTGSIETYIPLIIETHWTMFSRDSHIFFLEMCLKERDNAQIKADIRRSLEHYNTAYFQWWSTMLSPLGIDKAVIEETGSISLALIQGLLHDLGYTDDPEYFNAFLQAINERLLTMVRRGLNHDEA